MPHVSTQETVSETPPSPSPPPSLIPAHSQSEGTPDTTTREAVLVCSDSPPPKPAPVAPSLTKSPSCSLLLDQREMTDHPPHPWGPCIKDTTQYRCISHRISTRSIVPWLYIKINCRKHVIVYGCNFWEMCLLFCSCPLTMLTIWERKPGIVSLLHLTINLLLFSALDLL